MELHQVQPNLVTMSWNQPYKAGLKRTLDLACALMALALLWPVMLMIAVLIKLDSSGPAFFVQTRIGKGGRPFRIFKFRTMEHNLDDSAHRKFMHAFVQGNPLPGPIGNDAEGTAIYKPFDGAQVTRIGRILRKTSLDELPQLINVLKGEMSLVGPRPNVPWEVEAYREWHKERLNVLPGITGLAQVNGRSGIDFDTIARYDIEYVRQFSLGLDLRILLNTVSSVVSGQGAH